MNQQIAFPFSVNSWGRTTQASYSDHLRQMIEQVLFTSPGERVNRPDFGCNLRAIVFSPGQNELIAAIEAMVQASLRQWLGDLIQVQSLDLKIDGDSVTVHLQYLENQSQETRQVIFRS